MVLLLSCRDAFLTSVLLVLFSEARGDCGPPKHFPNAKLRQDGADRYSVGTRLSYTCLPGYELASQTRPVTECLDTSEWSEVSVTCQGGRCPFPEIENGRIAEDSDLRLGAQITFICDEGYRPIGRNGARCVLKSSSVVWDHDPPHCERIPCRPPPEIANGSHTEHDDYVYGSAVIYKCRDQLSLIGNSVLVCKSDQDMNGVWSGSAPECKEVECRLPKVSNGIMKTSYQPSYRYKDTIVFGCVPGYTLIENIGHISCGANSTWEPRVPQCILDRTGGDVTTGTDAGPTERSSVGSTINPTEETTKIEMGHTETTEVPATEPGPNKSISIGLGIAVGVLAVVATSAAILTYITRKNKRGKTITGSSHPESYAAVPPNADISLEEQDMSVKV